MTIKADKVFHRNWRQTLPKIDRGEGVYLFDDQGNRYLDGSGGPMLVSIGHGVQEITEAMVKQAKRVCFPCAGHFISEAQQQLAEKVIEIAPHGMAQVYFVSGGSEATEVALKVVRQYHLARGEPSRVKVISRWQSFHGATMGALSLSGHTQRRMDYLPYIINFPLIQPCYCYRCPFEKNYPSCEMFCAYELERTIKREGPTSIAAFIAEPIVSGALGCAVPPPEYFPIVRGICERYGILLISDEVVTGFGRTGKNFGISHWGVIPDVIVTGKGLSSGYAPLGAVIMHEKIVEVFLNSDRSSFFLGYTYSGNALSCSIGVAVLDYIQHHGLMERAARMGAYLSEQLLSLSELPMVGDIRGMGLLQGIELVRDKASKTPWERKLRVAETLTSNAFKKGLIIWPGFGTADGVVGEHIILSPPFTIEENQIEKLVSVLEETILETHKKIGHLMCKSPFKSRCRIGD